MDIPEEFAGHSRGGRPFVYRSGPKRWWVDASAFRDQQRCFKTWNGALAYALRVVGEAR